MPKFYNSRDLNFLQTIAEEVVNNVVEQLVTLFKMSVGETKTNLYGESLGKVWHAPADLACIVEREPPSATYEGLGPDNEQAIEFRFMRHKLRTWDIPKLRDINGTPIKDADSLQNSMYGYPEVGDVIFFDNSYYEINVIKDNKLIGGSPNIYDPVDNTPNDTRMELIVLAFMVRRSQIQIEGRNI